ncbi:MAG: ATP-dependent nuclease [Lacrimispora saccharolytica]
MFLKEVKVQNFRSLKNVDITFDESTILIGENNAGKSTLLDAIKKGLSRTGTRFLFDDYDFFMDSEMSSPKDSDGIKIILIFEERTLDEWEGFISDTFIDALQYLDGEKASILLQTTASYNEVTSDIEVKTVFLNNEFEPIVGKVQNLVNKFITLTPVFYLQALREIKDTFSAKSPLWGRFIKKAAIPQEELSVIQNQIKKLNTDIISNDENLTKLVMELQKIQKVMDFEGNEQDLVSINAMPIKTWDLLSKAQVVLNNGTSSMDFPIEKHGQGTQSVTTILLFKAYINILLKELSSDFAEGILTLEEPEAHLHPQAIRALHKSIEEMECQKIITTHSPYFIQNADIRNIRYIKKENGITVVSGIYDHICFTVDNVTDGLKRVVKAFGDFIQLNEDEKLVTISKPIKKLVANALRGCCIESVKNIDKILSDASMIFNNTELCNLNMYIQRNRGDILFARKWFLYEGQSEDVIIPYFAKMLGKDFDEHGINGIIYRGNGSAGAFIKLAKVLNIGWVLLGDNDEQGRKTKNEVLNCGYEQEDIEEILLLTKNKDFEHELAEVPSILADYEKILGDSITDDMKQLKAEGNLEEYKKKIVSLIQGGKVENAYKLIKVWNQRNFSIDEIPDVIKKLIGKV